MPLLQASGKSREFDATEVTFKCNIKYLIRGGAEGISNCDALRACQPIGELGWGGKA